MVEKKCGLRFLSFQTSILFVFAVLDFKYVVFNVFVLFDTGHALVTRLDAERLGCLTTFSHSRKLNYRMGDMSEVHFVAADSVLDELALYGGEVILVQRTQFLS